MAGFSVLLAAVVALLSSTPSVAADPSAVDGQIDLSTWDFAADGDIALLGDWQICWGQLLEPAEDCPHGWATMPVRGLWVEQSDSPFGGRGVATYRLRVVLPPDPSELALLFGGPHTSHRFFIDGVERGGLGVVSARADEAEMELRHRVYSLEDPGEELEFLVQVSNFGFRSGGLKRIWYIGLPDSVQAGHGKALLREGLVLSVGVVVGLFYLLLFAFGPGERARGYFGMACLLAGLRVVPASISGLGDLVAPTLSFALQTRLEYLGTALILAAAAGFARTKVADVAPPRLLWGLQLAALALAAILAIAPFELVLKTLWLQYVLAVSVMGTFTLSYSWAALRGVAEARLTAGCSFIYVGVVLHDVLRTEFADIGARIELYPYALSLWILIEGAELLRRFHKAFTAAEFLSEQLAEKNFALRESEAAIVRFVPFNLLRLLGKSSIQEVEIGDRARTQMSVLDCVIRLDDASASRSGAEDRIIDLAQQLADAIEPMMHHGEGFLGEVRGDGFKAFFPGSADPACSAGQEILRVAHAAGKRASEPSVPVPRVGVGIDTGPVLVRIVGDRSRVMWSVTGDAIDTAREIATRAWAARRGVWVSDETLEQLRLRSEMRVVHLPDAAVRIGGRRVAVHEVSLGQRHSDTLSCVGTRFGV